MSHIILIGFKNVGKTAIGRQLSLETKKVFIDLDKKIEEKWEQKMGTAKICREIMSERGEDFFRKLEHEVLVDALASGESAIISLGGGAPLAEKNQNLLAGHIIVNIIAPKNVVFERIMMNGRPAYFPKSEDSLVFFNKIWDERGEIYRKLATHTVDNSNSLDEAVKKIIKEII